MQLLIPLWKVNAVAETGKEQKSPLSKSGWKDMKHDFFRDNSANHGARVWEQ